MKKLERILAIGGIIIGLSLVSFGLHRDKNDKYRNYIKNSAIKTIGLVSIAVGYGFGMRKMIEAEEEYFKRQKKENYD